MFPPVEDDQRVYDIVLGSTLRSSSHEDTPHSYHSFKYSFEPDKIDKSAGLFMNDGHGQVNVEFSHVSGSNSYSFKGTQLPCKDMDYLLIFDPEQNHFVLEKQSSALQLQWERKPRLSRLHNIIPRASTTKSKQKSSASASSSSKKDISKTQSEEHVVQVEKSNSDLKKAPEENLIDPAENILNKDLDEALFHDDDDDDDDDDDGIKSTTNNKTLKQAHAASNSKSENTIGSVNIMEGGSKCKIVKGNHTQELSSNKSNTQWRKKIKGLFWQNDLDENEEDSD